MMTETVNAPSFSSTEASPKPQVYFDAVLQPHRSLSPAGFALMMTAIAVGGFAIGLSFFLAGAWPVMGFAGLEVLLLYLAFRMNYREARRAEHIRLTDDGLEVVRIKPNGRRSRLQVEPGWLSVSMDDPPEHHSQLVLRSGGKGFVLGAFLTPGERLEVAQALRKALDAYRAPYLAP